MGVSLDKDFIETIFKGDDADNPFDYLASVLNDDANVKKVQSLAPENANTLVLIYPSAIYRKPTLQNPSSDYLTYCGCYAPTE